LSSATDAGLAGIGVGDIGRIVKANVVQTVLALADG
jgi:hypothetical protein